MITDQIKEAAEQHRNLWRMSCCA